MFDDPQLVPSDEIEQEVERKAPEFWIWLLLAGIFWMLFGGWWFLLPLGGAIRVALISTATVISGHWKRG